MSAAIWSKIWIDHSAAAVRRRIFVRQKSAGKIAARCQSCQISEQFPAVALDQPLFAITKLIQWNWPEVYGEDKFVVLLGGLHIEVACLSTKGDLLDGSGWTSILAEVRVTTLEKADALLKSSHVKRARYAHTVTCSTLWTLLHQAFDAYREEDPQPLSFEDWCIR